MGKVVHVFDEDRKMWFVGLVAKEPEEEDFGIWYDISPDGESVTIETTWNEKKVLPFWEFANLVLQIAKEAEEMEER